MNLKKYFEFEQKPKKGLAAFEWVIMAYAAITLLIMLFCYTKLQNPEAMIWGRVRIVAITIGLWAAYRFIPCRAVMFLRVLVQMLLLGWWYMDTYNINSLFPNLDHIVASWDEYLFGFQPAMVFATKFSQPVLSEFLEISYASYYPIIIVVCVYYFLMRYHEFEKCCFIITGAFFTYYLIFDIIPVAGPMYYYPAIGYSNVAKGVFPAIGNYFTSHLGMMKPPGWTDGIGYHQHPWQRAAYGCFPQLAHWNHHSQPYLGCEDRQQEARLQSPAFCHRHLLCHGLYSCPLCH